MEEVKNSMRLEIMAKAENISLARLAVAAFASQLDLTLAEIEELKVVVSETVSNSIIHGYHGNNSGLVEIEARIYAGKLELVVNDQGKGIEDIELAREPSYTTDPERMGLGLSFVDSFMDQVEIFSVPGMGTKVSMTKYLQNSKGHSTE